MSTHCSFFVSIRVPAGGSKEEVFLQGSQAGEGWGKGIGRDVRRQFNLVTQSCQTLCTPWTAACQASLFITKSQSLLKLMSRESVMPSNHLIVILFSSCLQSFLATGSFPRSQFFAFGSWNIGVSASASALPMNIQDWSPLGWTDWISLQSKGLSRVSSNTTLQKHQFFSA